MKTTLQTIALAGFLTVGGLGASEAKAQFYGPRRSGLSINIGVGTSPYLYPPPVVVAPPPVVVAPPPVVVARPPIVVAPPYGGGYYGGYPPYRGGYRGGYYGGGHHGGYHHGYPRYRPY